MMARNAEEGMELPIRQTEHYRTIFNKYDTDQDGKINIQELKNIVESREYEHDIPEKVFQRIMTMSDRNNDGYLDFEEFTKMMNNPVLQPIFGHFNKYIHTLVPRRNRVGGTRPSSDVPDGQYEDEYTWCPPPVFMLLISLLEVILFCVDAAHGSTEYIDGPVAIWATFDPKRRYEAWRFITYMFVHVGYFHLIVNLLVQILLGLPLEMVHKGWRILIVYFCGVLAGSLATSITDPHVKLAGASGGVYSLITAHVASVIMNWQQMQMPFMQLFVFLVIIGSDFGTAIYYRYNGINEHIGYAAHLAGAVAGLLVGIFVLRNLEQQSFERKLWWVSLLAFVTLLTVAVVWNIAYPEYFM